MNPTMRYLIGEIEEVEKILKDDPTDVENIIYLEELKNDLRIEEDYRRSEERIGF